MAMNGIDISNNNPDFNLSRFTTTQFVIAKASGGGRFTDGKFRNFVSQALSLGKCIGAYHFAYDSTPGSVQEEVNVFCNAINDYIGKAILVLDWEDQALNRGPSWALQWLNLVYSKTKVKPLIYMSESVCSAYNWTSVANAGYKLWIAAYRSSHNTMDYQNTPPGSAPNPGVFGNYVMYQYTSSGRIQGGGSNNIDLNKFYGNASDWAALANGSGVFNGDSGNTQTGTPYTPRLERPEAGNKYYIRQSSGGWNPITIPGKPTDSGCDTLANCAPYAIGRFNEIGNYGSCKYLRRENAGRFIEVNPELPHGSEPKLGAVIVWKKTGGAGHVAVVEKITSSTHITTSESGYGGPVFAVKERDKGDGNWGQSSAYQFQGFIYNPAVTDDAYVVGDSGSYTGTSSVTRQITFADLGIDESQITPYIVAVEPDVLNINYAKLKELKVGGMMFFAGQYYDSATHLPRTSFRSPNLIKQVDECQKAGLMFALYTNVLARSVTEAKEELTQLYYTVSRYPPGAGIWLSLKFPATQTKSSNNQIIEAYYEYLSRYGLMEGCGFYVTESELELIDWELFQDRFQLWIRQPTDTLEHAKDVGTKVEPTFFKLGDARVDDPGSGSSTSSNMIANTLEWREEPDTIENPDLSFDEWIESQPENNPI